MYKQTPKFRRQLSQNQLEVLRVLYRYRFASRDLIAKYFNKKDVYRQLLILEDRGLIGKRYEPSYRFAGKPAAYYLKPEGMRALQFIDEDVNKMTIKKLYVAKQVSETFVDHCMTILAISLKLRHTQPTVKFFTKVDLQKDDYSYFPSPLPDAYIRVGDQHHFLIYIDNSKPFFTTVKWLKLLEEYYENGTWDDTGTEFPSIVTVLDDQEHLKKLTRFIENNIEDMKIRTALKSEMLSDNLPLYLGLPV